VKVLFVIDSLGAGGAEHSTAALLPILRERGHEVAVATMYDAGFGDEERIRSDGFDVRPLRSGRYVSRVRELRRRVRAAAPDVVHCALFSSDMVGRVAGWRTDAVVVSSFVNTPYDAARIQLGDVPAWKLRAVQAADAATARLVDHFHAVSQGVAAANIRALHVPRERVTVVERGRSRHALGTWSLTRRERVRKSLGIAETSKLVLAVGRQEHQKRHVDLIAAADAMLDQVPQLGVLVAGRSGNASSALQQALADHPRAAAITTLLGNRCDVPDLLCAADVLAIPSMYEGTAGAAIEAMALRCPVVCTDVTGVRGILRDGDNALLVPAAEPSRLADGLVRALCDDRLAEELRLRGLADFEERFTIEAAATRMEALYSKLAERHLAASGR
jgi:glycosyltransferase involved in cell wall biosynthesis